MILKNPTPEDSGTYRCEFDQQGVDTSTDVTIEIKQITRKITSHMYKDMCRFFIVIWIFMEMD